MDSDLKNIGVMIVDDHELWRKSFGALLTSVFNCNLIAEAANGSELLKLLKREQPEIIFLDLEMPVMSGNEVLKILRKSYLDIKVIVISFHSNSAVVEKCIAQGANAYLPKDVDLATLEKTLLNVLEEGESIDLSRRISEKLTSEMSEYLLSHYRLNCREISVLFWVCQGKSNKLISSELNIAERTVEHYKTNIYNKTGSKSMADLIAFGMQHGIVKA